MSNRTGTRLSDIPVALSSDATGKAVARVSESWLRLILYCAMYLPHGEIKVRIVNCEPTQLLDYKRSIRFDRAETLPPDLFPTAEGIQGH